jgi:hypothetical protein
MRKKKIKLADLLLENPTSEKPYEEFLWGQDRGKDEEDLSITIFTILFMSATVMPFPRIKSPSS